MQEQTATTAAAVRTWIDSLGGTDAPWVTASEGEQ